MTTLAKPPRLEVFLIVLLDVMGFGLIIPAQPFLAKHFGATASTVTLLGTTYALMQFLFAPLWGSLSDRVGRKPVLITTIFLTLLGHTAFGFASSLAMLFGARALAGLGAANISTAQAVLSDTHAPSERARAMALIGAAFGVGFVIGPGLGGVLFRADPSAPAFFAAVLAAINLAFVLTRVPETRFLQSTSARKSGSLLTFLKLDRQLKVLVLTTFLTMTAFALMEQTVGLFIESLWVTGEGLDRMRQATKLTSIFLVVVGVTAVLVQGYLVRKWLKTRSEASVFKGGLITLAISLALIPLLGFSGSYPLFLVSAALLALGSGMFNPAMAALVSLACPADKQGTGLALNQSGQALGRIVGPTLAGTLFAWGSSLPFLAGAALTLLALAFSSAILTRPQPETMKHPS